MAKRFKLRLSLPSFQFCRPKQTSKIPLPAATLMFSPINPKAFEIPYPNYTPDPPPSTPNHPLFSRHVSSSRITPVGHKLYNTSASDDSFDAFALPPPAANREKTSTGKNNNSSKASSVSVSISSGDSVWFSSEEAESLVSSSFDSSYDFGYPLSERCKNNKMINKKSSFKVRAAGPVRAQPSKPAIEYPVKKSVFRRLMPPCTVAKESVAVVKKSEDPYEDFKRSMLEMILDKQMYETEDLEQLLQCFLSLNSRHHHAVIVQAFSEIWETLFCKSPTSDHQK